MPQTGTFKIKEIELEVRLERSDGKLSRYVLRGGRCGDVCSPTRQQHSYGFRPGRSCQDAIQQVYLRVSKGRDTWVLEADIKGFFDNIAHESILNRMGNFPKRELIRGWLKAGFVSQGKLEPTEQGTPQGGVISPLLANIGLHGLEVFIKATNPKLGVVRYADDFIITARDKESLETAQTLIHTKSADKSPVIS